MQHIRLVHSMLFSRIISKLNKTDRMFTLSFKAKYDLPFDNKLANDFKSKYIIDGTIILKKQLTFEQFKQYILDVAGISYEIDSDGAHKYMTRYAAERILDAIRWIKKYHKHFDIEIQSTKLSHNTSHIFETDWSLIGYCDDGISSHHYEKSLNDMVMAEKLKGGKNWILNI